MAGDEQRIELETKIWDAFLCMIAHTADPYEEFESLLEKLAPIAEARGIDLDAIQEAWRREEFLQDVITDPLTFLSTTKKEEKE